MRLVRLLVVAMGIAIAAPSAWGSALWLRAQLRERRGRANPPEEVSRGGVRRRSEARVREVAPDLQPPGGADPGDHRHVPRHVGADPPRTLTYGTRPRSLLPVQLPGRQQRRAGELHGRPDGLSVARAHGFAASIELRTSIIACWLTVRKPSPGRSRSTTSQMTAANVRATTKIPGERLVLTSPTW